MSKKLRDKLYTILKTKFGEFCCNPEHNVSLYDLQQIAILNGKDPNQVKLCIDHIDNNDNHNQLWNLQFLCRSCNTKKNHPRTTEPSSRDAPVEYVAGKKNFKQTKVYVTGRLYDPDEHGALNYDNLIYDICAFVECSDTRARAYIKILCSDKHGLMTTEERGDGKLYVVWKNDEELNEVIKDVYDEYKFND